MIVDQNISPNQSLYYWGSIVLNVINNLPVTELDYFALYEAVRKDHDISIAKFSLTLDWLFILGAVKNNKTRINSTLAIFMKQSRRRVKKDIKKG